MDLLIIFTTGRSKSLIQGNVDIQYELERAFSEHNKVRRDLEDRIKSLEAELLRLAAEPGRKRAHESEAEKLFKS